MLLVLSEPSATLHLLQPNQPRIKFPPSVSPLELHTLNNPVRWWASLIRWFERRVVGVQRGNLFIPFLLLALSSISLFSEYHDDSRNPVMGTSSMNSGIPAALSSRTPAVDFFAVPLEEPMPQIWYSLLLTETARISPVSNLPTV